MKTFKIQGDMFKTTLHCVVGCSHREFLDYIKKDFGDSDIEEDDEAIGTIVEAENPKTHVKRYYMYLKKYDGSIDSICNVVHELNHFAFSVFSDRGARVGYEENEAFCYYHEMFLEKILNKLKR